MSKFLNTIYNRLSPYTPGEQPQGRQYIKLNTNESPFPPSPLVEVEVTKEIEKLNLYSDPLCKSVIHPLAQAVRMKPENVFVGNGSDEILAFCFQGFCEKGAAFADLTYGFYPVYAQLYGVEAEIIPLQEDFCIHVPDYYAKNKTIFIANPNAPTGLALDLEQLEQILSRNPSSLVVIDEAYVDFGAQSAITLLNRFQNLLVVGTFSKSRSLAGARLGYAVGSQDIIADLNRLKFSFNPYNVNRLTLAAGAASLQDKAYFSSCCKQIINTREFTIESLKKLGFICTNSKANFVFVSHPSCTGEELYHHLRENGILVRWFDLPRIDDYLRITIGTQKDMEALLSVLAIYVQNKE